MTMTRLPLDNRATSRTMAGWGLLSSFGRRVSQSSLDTSLPLVRRGLGGPRTSIRLEWSGRRNGWTAKNIDARRN